MTDYATALDIDDWTGATGKNISGTSDLAPLDQQEDMLVELFPDAKNVGILYCSAEPNSVYQATEFGKYLDEDGISHKEYTVADSNDIASVVQSAVSEVDVIYIPTDNTMAGQHRSDRQHHTPGRHSRHRRRRRNLFRLRRCDALHQLLRHRLQSGRDGL